jgi:hypothetical protein
MSVELPLRGLREAVGDLVPGVYVVTGPIGSGKTQLVLQIAAHCAGAGMPVVLSAPRIDPREVRARVDGIRTRTPWFDRLEAPAELPGSFELVHQLPASAGGLLVADHFSDDPSALLGRARRAAIDCGAIVLVSLEPTGAETVKTFVPGKVMRRSPPEIAEWIGVSPRAAAEADVLLVLAPDRPRDAEGWMTIELAVAKHRRRVPLRTGLRFNGTWFEDEAEHLDLGIE